MISKVFSLTLHGIDGVLVSVEIDIAPGLPSLTIVGLPDASVRESRDRVVSAVRNSGFDFPLRRITVNLAPADIKKAGPAFDLPIAIGILAAAQMVEPRHLEDWCMVGELALDGTLRVVKGALPMALEARDRKFKGFILPEFNYKEASVVKGIQVFPARNLREVIEFLSKEKADNPERAQPQASPPKTGTQLDFSDVKGQAYAKRAMEIAAAGGHNVLMVGPPGSGKTMIARCVGSILPPLELDESLETSKIHSAAGILSKGDGLVRIRPFRNPHHTISDIALIGGGQYPRPGEASLAQNGVLFLDELPEFSRRALEVLRQPLESREVVIARAKETSKFPASFMLIGAMNPCPCGYLGHPLRGCACTPLQIQRYMARVSGPLLDRMDIHLEVPALKIAELTSDEEPPEPSSAIRGRVVRARRIQEERFTDRTTPSPNNLPGARRDKSHKTYVNAQMTSSQVKKFCALDAEGRKLLHAAIERLGLSARAYDRILKVSRTIADLAASERTQAPHLAEAIQYRSMDRVRA